MFHYLAGAPYSLFSFLVSLAHQMMSKIIPIPVSTSNCHHPERPMSCKRRAPTARLGSKRAKFSRPFTKGLVPKTASMTSDKDYMMSQVEVHRKALNTLDTQLIPNAKNAELKSMLTQTRTAVATHLKKAEQIVEKMK